MQDPQRGQPHGVTVGAQPGHHHRGVRGDLCRGWSVVYSQRVVQHCVIRSQCSAGQLAPVFFSYIFNLICLLCPVAKMCGKYHATFSVVFTSSGVVGDLNQWSLMTLEFVLYGCVI